MNRYARIEDGTVVELITLPDVELDGRKVGISDIFPDTLSIVPCAGEVCEGWGFVDGSFHEFQPQDDLPVLKAQLIASIDTSAEVTRLVYITGGAGQAMTYQRKVEEARLCIAAEEPVADDFPMLSAEIGITGDTLAGVAETVIAAYNNWLEVGAQIERARLFAKKSIDAATTVDEAMRAAQVDWSAVVPTSGSS